MLKTIVAFHLTVACAVGASAAESPLVIENPHLLLRFDAGTGAWTGLVDKHAGDDLVVAGAVPVSVAPAPPPVLDSAQVARSVTAGQALDLAGEWFYTPTPSKTEAPADFLQGRFAAVPWVSTPVPSRRGAGDDRLHDRVGDFWYRREFQVPALWQDEELALVLVLSMTSTRRGSTASGSVARVRRRRRLGRRRASIGSQPGNSGAKGQTSCC